jgi:hypothetical protein
MSTTSGSRIFEDEDRCLVQDLCPLGSDAVPVTWAYFIVLSVAECALLLAIVWFAWKWPTSITDLSRT